MPAKGQNQFLQDHIVKWEHGLTYSAQLLELMPDSLWNFKPVKEEMSFREQVLHLSQNMYWLSSSYLNGEKLSLTFTDNGQSVSTIKTQFEETGKYTLRVLKKLEEEALSEKVNFFAADLTRWQIFELLHDHHTHHRGQLIVYLRLNGIKPPKYIGW
jgi:uncharacterized damage-inducible protein DinB